MAEFSLKFSISEVTHWARFYVNPDQDLGPMAAGAAARVAGFLTRDQFLNIARWKSVRPSRWHQSNDDGTVREVSRFALTTTVELLRLKAFTMLQGVQVPTSSTFLHVCFSDPYPILDVRAFWTLGIDKMPGNLYEAWPDYVRVCRSLADQAGVDMRTLDRALWGYSFSNRQAAAW